MMFITIAIIIGLSVLGMCIVRVRSDHSRLSALIPGFNYYVRTQIAGRSMSVSIITTLTNLVLLAIIMITRYRLSGRAHDHSIWYHIISYLETLPQLLQSQKFIIISRLVLQVRVNRGVAHRRGRGLWTGLELTFLAPIFRPILGLSHRPDTSESE